VLPVLAPLASLSLAGQEHGRTIPLADVGSHLGRRAVSAFQAKAMRSSSRRRTRRLRRARQEWQVPPGVAGV